MEDGFGGSRYEQNVCLEMAKRCRRWDVGISWVSCEVDPTLYLAG
jgi:hypothetical protein